VMISCVGARVPERTYCSRICCMTEIKNASLIKEMNPKARVWVLHRDLMAYGVDFENYYRKSMEQGVRFIRYELEKPPQVTGNGKANKVKVWHQIMGRELELPVDMVVLTTPLIPRAENEELSKMLKVPLSEQRFFLEAHLKLMPVEFATDGIYICGSARWPTDTTEGIAQAYAAAAKAAVPLRRGFVRPEAITAWVDEDKCSGCGVCEPLCPFNAVELQSHDDTRERVSHIQEALCKGCGTCSAACPSSAITMNHFRDIEIMAQIEALFSK
jgi:heterodisulfide reductase subunit A